MAAYLVRVTHNHVRKGSTDSFCVVARSRRDAEAKGRDVFTSWNWGGYRKLEVVREVPAS